MMLRLISLPAENAHHERRVDDPGVAEPEQDAARLPIRLLAAAGSCQRDSIRPEAAPESQAARARSLEYAQAFGCARAIRGAPASTGPAPPADAPISRCMTKLKAVTTATRATARTTVMSSFRKSRIAGVESAAGQRPLIGRCLPSLSATPLCEQSPSRSATCRARALSCGGSLLAVAQSSGSASGAARRSILTSLSGSRRSRSCVVAMSRRCAGGSRGGSVPVICSWMWARTSGSCPSRSQRQVVAGCRRSSPIHESRALASQCDAEHGRCPARRGCCRRARWLGATVRGPRVGVESRRGRRRVRGAPGGP